MDEIITWRVLLSLVIILLGIYIFKKIIKDKLMGAESIEASFLSIFALITFSFLIVSKYSHKIKEGVLLDKDFSKAPSFS